MDLHHIFAPALAESWETPEPTRWRFHLRNNVKFHDGSPFTADDVIFSAQRVRAPGSNFTTNVPADAEFVKARTGYSIGGVSPVGHAQPPVTLIDRELFRFDEIWAAAGHPHGVFKLRPQDLERLTGAPVADVVQQPSAA